MKAFKFPVKKEYHGIPPAKLAIAVEIIAQKNRSLKDCDFF